MKKPLKSIIAFSLSLSMLSLVGFSQAKASTDKFAPSLPNYQKLDKDFAKDLKSEGKQLKGKKLHGYKGKSYFQPGNLDNLTHKDVRGHDNKGIAILVDFPVSEGNISDVPGVDYEQIPKEKFQDLMNGTEYNPYDLEMFKWLAEYEGVKAPTDRTLRNYYDEVSYGQFSIDVDVVGWYTLPHSYEYYLGQNNGYYNENGDANFAELVKDALMLADKDVDFTEYAVDAKPGDFDILGIEGDTLEQDGETYTQIVPNVFIIHRGTGAEYSADPSIIWSHQWDIISASYFGDYYKTGEYPNDADLRFTTVDGVVVNEYNTVPEVGQDISGYYIEGGRKPSPAYPGVFAHEFGHQLGLPDQYDYGYDSEGTGVFTLMASGASGRNIPYRWYSDNTPTHMDAWSKYYLGFIQPREFKPEDGRQTITLKPASEYPQALKVEVPGSNGREYFLIENRQQTGYDAGLEYNFDENPKDLHGLVVYHIDENVFIRNFNRPNEAANWDWNNRGRNYRDKDTGENHYAIAVVQADGNWDMEKGINDGDCGDVFPGKYGITELNSNIKSNPNTLSYYRWDVNKKGITGLIIENIVEENGVVTFDIFFEN
ncbi:M6 family metalloprotease domain-containing protein [Oceanirhabdus sp. W0125-5]|uniref:M6 family metalloprotease domain-containing protein n=1 Tax=Oceanirhabdus sp. W0125-5 TaxID=2999116 RepID=UPI0022F31812|nr:M6 family metalloprotease domain-containing protein [Oceanirhabdus sp. W0125-5]WBW96884.1 M6 family metalloprotease domain-containing protein [Oceanirhabdus sp. W0125-5]